jgi:hypothetical protein
MKKRADGEISWILVLTIIVLLGAVLTFILIGIFSGKFSSLGDFISHFLKFGK